MRAPTLLLAVGCMSIVLAARCAALDPGESLLRFVDARLQLGVEQGLRQVGDVAYHERNSPVATLTVMAGDIGSARMRELDWASDLGIVLGLRLSAVDWEGGRETDRDQRDSLDAF